MCGVLVDYFLWLFVSGFEIGFGVLVFVFGVVG